MLRPGWGTPKGTRPVAASRDTRPDPPGGCVRCSQDLMLGPSALLSWRSMVGPMEVGAVEYTDVEVDDGRTVRCVSTDVFPARRDGVAVELVPSGSQRPFEHDRLRLEGLSPGRGCVVLLAELRAAMRDHNVYREKCFPSRSGS